MRSKMKEKELQHFLPHIAGGIGCLSVLAIGFSGTISKGAIAIWLLLIFGSWIGLVKQKLEPLTLPCIFLLLIYTAEVSMQLQIEHSFRLLISYQRIVDISLYCLIYALLSTITKRKSTGMTIANILFWILCTLNFAITVFRGKPVYFPDFYSVKTALAVAGEYTFPFSKIYLCCSVMFVVCSLFCRSLRYMRGDLNGTLKKRLVYSCCILMLPIAMMVLRVPTKLCWRSYYFSTTEYWLYSFSMSAYQMYVEKPETYASFNIPIQETSDTQEESIQSMPNVLFIVNESFADLRVISSFAKDDEVMPFFDTLSADESTQSGNLHVSIYGGNTANTEFEVLTGVSMYHLPYDTTAFNLYVNSPTVSLASYFNDLGYRTIAFHPSAKTNYNRNHVYPNLGFSETYFQEDFDDLETLRTFTSDRSNYEKVIKMFENKEMEERLFLFNLTVQNHGPFDIYDDAFQDKVNLEDESLNITQQYLSCIRYSDEALEGLIDYLEDYPEPVAVVFLGDHQAKIDDVFYERLYKKSGTSLSNTEVKKKYIVPYLVWTNYGAVFDKVEAFSANYLGAYVVEQLDLPQTGYQKFLNSMREKYPIITAQGIGENMDIDFRDDSLLAYENCCYNLLFDKDNLWHSIHETNTNGAIK